MKIAIIHEWLVTYAGSERVLEQILQLFPEADLYSLVEFLPENEKGFILNKNVGTSFIQLLPFARKKFRNYFPLMTFAIEKFDVSNYNLVISSSHAFAKGIRTNKNQLHICYCHTPMRYVWDFQNLYLKEAKLDRGLKGILIKKILNHIRTWDQNTAKRVNHFIANSNNVARRIETFYNREAFVIYPPVDIDKFQLETKKEDFFVTASRMVPYKRIELIVEAFSEMPDRKLVVIGDGPDFKKIREKAKKNVILLGYQKDNILKDYLQKARAFIFAAEEDFGILPVEAQTCGTPVIAYSRGGALETIIENKTGIFFKEQTVKSLIEAVIEFEKRQDQFDCFEIRKNAERFSRVRFKEEFKEFVDRKIRDFFQ